MKLEKILEIERDCKECAGFMLVGWVRDGRVVRLDPVDVLKLINDYKNLLEKGWGGGDRRNEGTD